MAEKLIETTEDNHILYIYFNRPAQKNAFNMQMLKQLSEAYLQLEENEKLQVAVVAARGKHFTLGLELDDVAKHMKKHKSYPFIHGVDPWGIQGKPRTKPVIVAAHGFCLTLGIELMLASDIRIAAPSTKFGQIEVQRGIMAFGGATFRMPQQFGWGNAMRYLLTGDMFGADEALRIGLIQEVVPQADLEKKASELALKITQQAPLAVRATLASAMTAFRESEEKCRGNLMPVTLELMKSSDAEEGVNSFIEKRQAKFQGK